MTSQVMPYRNFYSPSVLQESYLGCLFELGSLQEGRTPFLFKRPIRSRTDDLRLYLEYLGGRSTSSFRCSAYLFDWVREQSSLLAFYWPSTHWYLPEMSFISDSNTCQIACLSVACVAGVWKGRERECLSVAWGRRRISGRLMDFLG